MPAPPLSAVPDPDPRRAQRLGPDPDASVTPDPGLSPSSSPDDLLRRIARGDRQAFDALYDAFAARVLGLALRVVRDMGHAEEVTQEVFLELWRRGARFDDSKGSATSWIMTLTHSRAVDRVRAAKASAARDLKVAQASAERDVDSVVEAVENVFERRAVRRCLSALTDLQRESVTLAYYNGFTAREVAELLTVPLPTVKTRLRDGLIRLRDCLGVPA